MRNLIYAFSVFFLSLSLSAISFADQSGMEKALSGVQSLDDLLGNKTQLEAYYAEVNSYYQGKISRAVFDVMIGQMRVLNRENPEFGRRLLKENTGVTPYKIISDVKTYGRSLVKVRWEDLEKNLFGDPEPLDHKTLMDLEKVSQKIKDFESQLQGNKKEQGLLRAEFYTQLKSKNEKLAKRIVSNVYLKDESLRSMIDSRDPDILLYIFETGLKQRLAAQGYPENTLSLLASVIPRVSDLIENKEIFPINKVLNKKGVLVPAEPMSSTVFVFETFKRPLHAVWKGIWLGECVGGGNEQPTPRRWATVVLDKVNNYVVEKNGGFIGFIQELGMQKKDHSPVYYATEFGTPNLKEDILQFDPVTKQLVKRKMIDVWLEVAPQKIVRVKSNSSDINNAGVLGALRESNVWNLKTSKGNAKDFQLADQGMADFVIDSSQRNKMTPTLSYGEGIISDGTSPKATRLEVLKTVKWSKETFMKYLMNKRTSNEAMIDALKKMDFIRTPVEIHDFMTRFYELNGGQNPLRVYELAEYFYGKDSSALKAYGERLMSVGTLATKLDIAARYYSEDTGKLFEFLDTLNIGEVETKNFLEKNLPKGSANTESTVRYLAFRAMKLKMVSSYPIIAQNKDEIQNFFVSQKDELLKLISELGPEHYDVLKKSILEYLKGETSEMNKVLLFNLAKKVDLVKEFRKTLKAFHIGPYLQSRVTTEANPHFIEEVLQSAIQDKDLLFLESFIKTNGWFYKMPLEKKVMNKFVSDIIKTKDRQLLELIAAPQFASTWASLPGQVKRSLLPESAAFWDILRANRNIDGQELVSLLLKISPEVNSLATPVAETPAKPKAEVKEKTTEKPAAAVPAIVDITEDLQRLFAAPDSAAVDSAQRQIQQKISPDKEPTAHSVQIIREYLHSTTAQNIDARQFQVMALFEISAQTAEIPHDIYNSSKVWAQQILARPEYTQYRGAYSSLLAAQKTKPRMCSAVFF